MFEKFSDASRRAMSLANQSAQSLGHEALKAEHILIGLIDEASCNSNSVMHALGIDLKGIRVEAAQNATSAVEFGGSDGSTPLLRAKNVVRNGLEVLHELQHAKYDTHHLLLGLLMEWECRAAQILFRAGVTTERVRGLLMQG